MIEIWLNRLENAHINQHTCIMSKPFYRRSHSMVDCANLLMISRQEIALNRNPYLVEIPVLSISTYRLKVHQNEKQLIENKISHFLHFQTTWNLLYQHHHQHTTDEDSFWLALKYLNKHVWQCPSFEFINSTVPTKLLWHSDN